MQQHFFSQNQNQFMFLSHDFQTNFITSCNLFKFIKCFKHNFKILMINAFQNLPFQKDMELTIS